MSSDNAIAILVTSDTYREIEEGHWVRLAETPVSVWRVAHIQGHDQFDHFLEREIHNLGVWMQDLFRKAEVFLSEAEAKEHASKLCDTIPILEHGIVRLDARGYNFPNC